MRAQAALHTPAGLPSKNSQTRGKDPGSPSWESQRPGLWGNRREPTLGLSKGSPACGEEDVVESRSQSEVRLAQPCLKKQAIFLAG